MAFPVSGALSPVRGGRRAAWTPSIPDLSPRGSLAAGSVGAVPPPGTSCRRRSQPAGLGVGLASFRRRRPDPAARASGGCGGPCMRACLLKATHALQAGELCKMRAVRPMPPPAPYCLPIQVHWCHGTEPTHRRCCAVPCSATCPLAARGRDGRLPRGCGMGRARAQAPGWGVSAWEWGGEEAAQS